MSDAPELIGCFSATYPGEPVFLVDRDPCGLPMLRSIVLLLCCLLALRAGAQVNAYAEVMGVAGTTLTLSGAVETFDTFEDGAYARRSHRFDRCPGSRCRIVHSAT